MRVSLGNKHLAPAHRSNPVLAPEEQFWYPVFVKPKKDYIDQEAGEKYETKVVGNGSSHCFVHTDEFNFVWSIKNGNGRQNRSSGAKTGLLQRAGAKT